MENENYLRYNGYEIVKMNLNLKEEQTEENDLKFLFKIKPLDDDLNKIEVYQGILLNPNNSFPYEIEVLIKGNFELSKKLDLDKKKEIILVNVPAIQYPFIRSLISLISSQTDYEKILLPTINFTKMFKIDNWDKMLTK